MRMNEMWATKKWEWCLPRPIIWIALGIFFLIPAFTLSWFLMKFNLPFLHSGDRGVIVGLALVWWLSATALIFGWRLKR
jgi:hypothetical protein